MPRINTGRISDILRSLSSPVSATKKTELAKNSSPIVKAKIQKRDENTLKIKLISRLTELQKHPEEFEKNAPLVAVQEIMIWEFGDQFLNHHDFKKITSLISYNIKDSPELTEHMSKMIKTLLDT
jgi:hypothetical protein